MNTDPLALIDAARTGDTALVRELLAAGADPNGRVGTATFDDPPLAAAVEVGSIECVRLLLAAGADVNARLGYACIAARSTSAGVFRELLDAGADRTWQGIGEGLAQHIAVADAIGIEERTSMLRVLREHGGDIDHGEHFPTLWTVAQSYDSGAVDALLRAGADPQVHPNPLGGAVWGSGSDGTERVIDLLVTAGCDVRVRDVNGLGLMHGALTPYNHGQGFMSSDGINVPAIRALLRHGLSIDITLPDGRRPLHVAADEADAEAVELLLSVGASPHELAPDGRTACDLAAHRNRQAQARVNELRNAVPGSQEQQEREFLLSRRIPDAERCIALLAAGVLCEPAADL